MNLFTIQVLISRNGVLQQENLPNTVTESFWIGPSLVSVGNEILKLDKT